MTGGGIGRRWREFRLPAEGLHLDSAACSRQSLASIEAAGHHARLESEIGGYVAADEATAIIAAGRAGVAMLTGMRSEDVTFTTGSRAALDTLLRAWGLGRTAACLPGEYGANLALFSEHGFTLTNLQVDPLGRVDLDAAAATLQSAPPAMVHLTAVASHRGVVQPIAALSEICRRAGVPLIIDAAQALGHIDCMCGADAIYSSSRKWLAGPRGVGVLSIRSTLAATLNTPSRSGGSSSSTLMEAEEANVAAQVAFSVAVRQHLDVGPVLIREQLAALGGATRFTLSGIPGWRVVEPVSEPTAITTLEPSHGTDPAWIRDRLLADHGIVTTAVSIAKAPGELTTPVLRISPHIDTAYADLDKVAEALSSYSSVLST